MSRPYDVLPVLFVMVKATEGSDIKDKSFRMWYNEAGRHRIIRWAYHVLTLLSPVDKQVTNYLKTVRNFQTADMPPILDVEDRRCNKDLLIKNALKWLRLVERRTGKRPMLYIGESLYRDHILKKQISSYFKRYPLWIASYNHHPASNIHYTFWQFTKAGFVNGSQARMDID